MHVKRFKDAKPYDAPNHRGYTSLRLFGAEAGGTKGLVFGYSHFLPQRHLVFRRPAFAL